MKKAVLFILISSCFFACIPQKNITYFNPSGGGGNTPKPEEHLISTGDVLRISLNSQAITPQMELLSKAELPVKSDGTIDLPLLQGSVKVKGLTIKTARDTLTRILSRNFQNPELVVTLVAFPIIVMGETNNPGIIMVPGDQINIIQALMMSGDMSQYGKRRGVKVVRGQDSSTQKVFDVDLTSMDIFKSEVYYLKSNDIIYIPPFRAKALNLTVPIVSFTLTILNTVLIIYALYSK